GCCAPTCCGRAVCSIGCPSVPGAGAWRGWSACSTATSSRPAPRCAARPATRWTSRWWGAGSPSIASRWSPSIPPTCAPPRRWWPACAGSSAAARSPIPPADPSCPAEPTARFAYNEPAPMTDLLFVLLALGLVALNAFFVATEFAIVRVRTTRIDELVTKGVRRAAATRTVLQDLNAYLSACQLGITLASLALGWVGESATHLLEPHLTGLGTWAGVTSRSIAGVLAFVSITVLHVVVGEQAPKTVAIERAEGVALLVAWPIRVFH